MRKTEISLEFCDGEFAVVSRIAEEVEFAIIGQLLEDILQSFPRGGGSYQWSSFINPVYTQYSNTPQRLAARQMNILTG
jgi:hypothetical protein